MSSDVLLAIGTVATAAAAAFATVYTHLASARRERNAAAIKAYDDVMERWKDMANELRGDLGRARAEIERQREEIDELREERDNARRGRYGRATEDRGVDQ